MKHRFPLVIFPLALTVQPAGAMWKETGVDFLSCQFSTDPTRDVCAEWIDVSGNISDLCCVDFEDIENPWLTIWPGNCYNLRPVGADAGEIAVSPSQQPPAALSVTATCGQSARAACAAWLPDEPGDAARQAFRSCVALASTACSPLESPLADSLTHTSSTRAAGESGGR